MHLDTVARGQVLTHPGSGRKGTVLAVGKDDVRIQLATGKRITITAVEKEICWQKPRRSHLTLRSIGAAR